MDHWGLGELGTILPTGDIVESLHDFGEFSQPSKC